MKNKKLPLVVIFGRTNVGKSSLFNTLSEKQKALVSTIPGTTRESNLNTIEWTGKEFMIVDTGGIMDEVQNASRKKINQLLKGEGEEEKIINLKVQKQALAYLGKADIILFLVDGRAGLLPQDKEMAVLLKKMIPVKDREKIIIVANKIDSEKIANSAAEFNKLGIGKPFLVSAATGRGTGDLLDEIVRLFKKKRIKALPLPENELEKISVCLLGKPNVGKSSLFNKLLGTDEVIVSDIPHTTREPKNMEITYKDRTVIFIDTAGISRQGSKSRGLEKYGIERSLSTLKKSDIVLLVLDISQEITRQDARLVEEISDAGKSLVIIANKWDKIPEKDTKKYKNYIYSKLPFATWAPIQFTSALTGSKVDQLLDLAITMDEQRKIRLSVSQLNKFLNSLVKIHRPTKGGGIKKPRIYEIIQEGINPPKFKVRIGAEQSLDKSYVRFIKNKLREKFGFFGTSISIYVANNPKIHGRKS